MQAAASSVTAAATEAIHSVAPVILRHPAVVLLRLSPHARIAAPGHVPRSALHLCAAAQPSLRAPNQRPAVTLFLSSKMRRTRRFLFWNRLMPLRSLQGV